MFPLGKVSAVVLKKSEVDTLSATKGDSTSVRRQFTNAARASVSVNHRSMPTMHAIRGPGLYLVQGRRELPSRRALRSSCLDHRVMSPLPSILCGCAGGIRRWLGVRLGDERLESVLGFLGSKSGAT